MSNLRLPRHAHPRRARLAQARARRPRSARAPASSSRRAGRISRPEALRPRRLLSAHSRALASTIGTPAGAPHRRAGWARPRFPSARRARALNWRRKRLTDARRVVAAARPGGRRGAQQRAPAVAAGRGAMWVSRSRRPGSARAQRLDQRLGGARLAERHRMHHRSAGATTRRGSGRSARPIAWRYSGSARPRHHRRST